MASVSVQAHARISAMSPSRDSMICTVTKGLLNAPGQNNCFLNSAVQDPPVSREYYIRLRCNEEMEWITLESGHDYYEILKLQACKTFPHLIGEDIKFTDEVGAVIKSDFLPLFLNISQVGVIIQVLKISEKEILEILPVTSSSNKTCDTPFSVFSKAYTGGINSCSTETMHCLSVDSNNSWLNFDSEDFEMCPKKKKLKTSYTNFFEITNEVLKNYLLSHSGGKEIISFYKEHKTLDDTNRKRLVNIVVEHMFQYMPTDLLPSHETKLAYAKCIVYLFPKLKDPLSEGGFEAFYDPHTKKGWISTRIRNLARTTVNNSSSPGPSTSTNLEVNDKNYDADIILLKFATSEQREIIFEKTETTFHVRNNNRKNVLKDFPRFLDTDGLIDLEFKLMFPAAVDTFKNNFSNIYGEILRKMYRISVKNPDSTLIQCDERTEEDISDEWDSDTKLLIILLHLLLPTSSKKEKKISSRAAVEKLILFQHHQTPLQTILENRKSKQPFILAVGTRKSVITSYFIIFDDKIVPSPRGNIIIAFDCLFKCHYVFDLKYDEQLKFFFQFVQAYFYKIDINYTTSRMREIRTKIENEIDGKKLHV